MLITEAKEAIGARLNDRSIPTNHVRAFASQLEASLRVFQDGRLVSVFSFLFSWGGVCADDNDDGVEKKTRDDAAIGSIDRRHRRLETVLPHGRR